MFDRLDKNLSVTHSNSAHLVSCSLSFTSFPFSAGGKYLHFLMLSWISSKKYSGACTRTGCPKNLSDFACSKSIRNLTGDFSSRLKFYSGVPPDTQPISLLLWIQPVIYTLRKNKFKLCSLLQVYHLKIIFRIITYSRCQV